MSTESKISPPATRRGRPAGRTALQEERHRKNRMAILQAAETVFSKTPYVRATIDELIAAAGVSRATFYAHFESKYALALASYDGIRDDWIAHCNALPDIAPDDTAGFARWITRLADLYVEHGFVTPLVTQLQIFEPGFRQRLIDERHALIERLAEAGLGGFAQTRGSEDIARLHHARAELLLKRIDLICSEITTPDLCSPATAERYVRIAAEELVDFIKSS